MTETHQPHPRIAQREQQRQINVAEVRMGFNAKLAVWITRTVGSMWCAYAFAALALISLPAAIQQGTVATISWISQTFLQLVLLSVIMVGQQVLAKASDKQAAQTYQDAEALLQISDATHQLIISNSKLTDEMHELLKLNTKLTDEIHSAVTARDAELGPGLGASLQQRGGRARD